MFLLASSRPNNGAPRRNTTSAPIPWRRTLNLFLIFLIGSLTGNFPGTNARAANARGERPQLFVVFVVDQLRGDYEHRFRAVGDSAGRDSAGREAGVLAQIKQRGARYSRCEHGHAFTFTGPGHAVIACGAFPRRSGIIGNSWYDRQLGKTVNCVSDPDARIIGAPSTKTASPSRLVAPTVGDALKQGTGGKAKVYSIAFKDRAAILTAGKLADAAFWFDTKSGNWVTCDAYADALPPFIRIVNEQRLVNRYGGKVWKPLLAPSVYRNDRPDGSPLERPGYGASRSFPHQLVAANDKNYIGQLQSSPFGNEFVLESAWQIVIGAGLGQDDVPDLLYINLSSNDYLGHQFGPNSREVEDMFYRTDQQIGRWLGRLDKHFAGKLRWTAALTADHGVAPIPEYSKSLGLAAKRIESSDLNRLRGQLEASLRRWRQLLPKGTPDKLAAKPLIQHVESNQVFLNRSHPAFLKGDSFAAAQKAVRDRLIRLGFPDAMTRDELLAGHSSDPVRRRMQRAFHPDRSGDVLYVAPPYHVFAGSSGTSHGTPWSYDTHVPMWLLGHGIRHGNFHRAVMPGDLAATISTLLEVAPPACCEHQTLHEAIQ